MGEKLITSATRVFPYSPDTLPSSMLDEGLHALVVAGLLFRRGEGADAIYIFKHALVQDAAYENLLRAKRTVLHRAIAKELIAGAESASVRPEVIGHHCEHAGLLEDAIKYYLQGAELAAAQSGLTEAGHCSTEHAGYLDICQMTNFVPIVTSGRKCQGTGPYRCQGFCRTRT